MRIEWFIKKHLPTRQKVFFVTPGIAELWRSLKIDTQSKWKNVQRCRVIKRKCARDCVDVQGVMMMSFHWRSFEKVIKILTVSKEN